MSRGSRGHAREREVRRWLGDRGFWTCRAAGSLGEVDVVASRAVLEIPLDDFPDQMLVEVKTDKRNPYDHFGRERRRAMSQAAELAGIPAWLCWWPGDRKGPRWIEEAEWPSS